MVIHMVALMYALCFLYGFLFTGISDKAYINTIVLFLDREIYMSGKLMFLYCMFRWLRHKPIGLMIFTSRNKAIFIILCILNVVKNT